MLGQVAAVAGHAGRLAAQQYGLADYERLAVLLGRHPARVASYKRYLADHGRGSPLFDLPSIVRSLETAFERLALKHRA